MGNSVVVLKLMENKAFSGIELLFGVIITFLIGSIIWLFVSGKNETMDIDELVTNDPTPTLMTTLPSPKPTLIPLVSPIINPPSEQAIVTVPSNWVEYSDQDAHFGFKTTLSVPPEFVFRFSGSEWYISDQNHPDADDWDYLTSIFNGEDPSNYYDKTLPWRWYQKYLNGNFFEDIPDQQPEIQIIEVSEFPVIGREPYYKVIYQYRSSGRKVTTYLYLQNGIIHILKPNTDKAKLPESEIAENIASIFFTLQSTLLPN